MRSDHGTWGDSLSVMPDEVGSRERLRENQRADGPGLFADLLTQFLVQQLLKEEPHHLKSVLLDDLRTKDERDGQAIAFGRANDRRALLRELVGRLLDRCQAVGAHVDSHLYGRIAEDEGR